jgi:hypothetical protein
VNIPDEASRLAVLEAAAGPSAVPCPSCTPCLLCGGLHKVRADVAMHWVARNVPTSPPPPEPKETLHELPELPETD